jgi:hypothetical protein
MKTLFRRLLTGWVLAVALTGGYWGMMLAPVNRWSMYFTRLDFWALLALTLAGGTLLGLGAFAAERLFPRCKPLLAASFWAWFVLAFANNFPELRKTLVSATGWKWLTGPVWWLFLWTAGAIGMASALLFPRWRRATGRFWRSLRLLFWPVLFFVPFSLWRVCLPETVFGNGLDFSKVPGNGKPPVVVFMFDMLPYEGLFGEDGEVVPACTNFAAFCGTADVYHAAASAGTSTSESIPGFIVQKRFRDMRCARDGWFYADGENGRIAPADFAAQSLPALAKAGGGRAQAIGMNIPWDALLPGLWDADESMSIYIGRHGVHAFGEDFSFWTAAKDLLAWYFLFVSKSPLSAVLKLAGFDGITESQGWDERASTVARAGRFLRELLSPGDFFFVHVDLPHPPFVLGPGGARLPHALYHSDEGLLAQVEGADWALGRWLEDLDASPAGRGAWVIVTSDHGLHNVRNPFPRKGAKDHVPFLVRRPGRTERRDIWEPADLPDLRHLLPDLPLWESSGENGGL